MVKNLVSISINLVCKKLWCLLENVVSTNKSSKQIIYTQCEKTNYSLVLWHKIPPICSVVFTMHQTKRALMHSPRAVVNAAIVFIWNVIMLSVLVVVVDKERQIAALWIDHIRHVNAFANCRWVILIDVQCPNYSLFCACRWRCRYWMHLYWIRFSSIDFDRHNNNNKEYSSYYYYLLLLF